jgi:lipooligosaccharide transport system ATP-binding protein
MIVEIRSLSKHFGGHVAVDGVDLDVPAGACFGLLGPNGAGKTTTLRLVYGVTEPTGGTIRVFGLQVGPQTRAVRARLGVTLQENVVIEALSPVENLRVFGRYHLLREPVLSRRVDDLVGFLELGTHADVPVRALSGGFRRRLAIALSLMNEPELHILDEPTTGLDPAVRLALWDRIRSLRTEGTTVLLTTHYMDEAQRLCDTVAIMAAGRIISIGAPRTLIEQHVAREAVEVTCSREEERDILGAAAPTAQRVRTGSRVMAYLDEPAGLVDHIRSRDPEDRRSLVVRPANLEDVFLALTGTSLEGGA